MAGFEMCANSFGFTLYWAAHQILGSLMLTIDKLLEHLEIEVRPFAVCSVGRGERLMLGPREEATVHYVVSGNGSLSFPDFSDFDS